MATKNGRSILKMHTVLSKCSFTFGDSTSASEDIHCETDGRSIGRFTVTATTNSCHLVQCEISAGKEFAVVAVEAHFVVNGKPAQVVSMETACWGDCLRSSVTWGMDAPNVVGRTVILNLFVSYTRDEGFCNTLKRIRMESPPAPPRPVSGGAAWQTGRLCDVTLKLKGGRTIGANMSELMFLSPVFWAMFTYKLRGKKENSVSIPDISYEAMHEILRFMYMGQVDTSDATRTKELLEVSERYDLPELAKVCEKALIYHVEKCPTLALALLPYSAKQSLGILFEWCELAILGSADVTLDLDLLKLAAQCGATNLEKVAIARLTMKLPRGLYEIREFDPDLADDMIMYRLSHEPAVVVSILD